MGISKIKNGFAGADIYNLVVVIDVYDVYTSICSAIHNVFINFFCGNTKDGFRNQLRKSQSA
ncbi:hypothetical protein A8L48_23705 [Rhizobium rhizogenes]|nr:hypothetical protein A8L48_23705 [Rhizobium rhizogenes]